MLQNIICGDCLSILPYISDSSVDLVITSPPYLAGKEYEDCSDIDSYKKFAEAWVKHIPRIISPRGSFWLNVGYIKTGKNEALPLTYLYYPLVKMKLVQEIVWYYRAGMIYKKRFAHRTERWMWFCHDPENVVFNLDIVRDRSLNIGHDKRCNPLGKNPEDLWNFNRVVGGTGRCKEKTNHPCQFPILMIERIIKACSDEGNVVFDPFAGSGTTLIAAEKLNRQFLGIEKKWYYCQDYLNRRKNIRRELF